MIVVNVKTFVDDTAYLIIVSIASQAIAVLMVYFMFRATTVQGVDRTYKLGPDLGIRSEVMKEQHPIPEEAPCGYCEKIVYKPFRCPDCKQLFCGIHSLPTDHECQNLHIQKENMKK